MEPLRPKALIFDLGCTLIEYEAIGWDELAKDAVANGHTWLEKRGLALGKYEDFYAAYIEIRNGYRKRAADTLLEWTIQDAVRDLLVELDLEQEVDEDLVEGFFDAYYEPVAEQLFVYDDTVETLEALSHKYNSIGLISNTVFPERVHQIELERFGIKPYIEFGVFSSSFGVRKPHEGIFYHAANLAGYAPSECLYIGDRYVEDIQGPNAIGMPAILKRREQREYPDDMPEAAAQVSQLSELLDVL
jgi:HAD superfamily hydrolase (TIGR01549 family)